MSTPVGNSAANASGNGPALGYSLKLWLFILFMLICVISINMFTCFILLLKVIEILLVYTFNFGIKIYRKLPRYLTTWPCVLPFAFCHTCLIYRSLSDQRPVEKKLYVDALSFEGMH